MATYSITTSGSVGLTDGSSAHARRAAVLSSLPSSIGLSSTVHNIANRGIAMSLQSIGLSSTPPASNTRHAIVMTPSSIGIEDVSTITYLGPAHHKVITFSGSIGLSDNSNILAKHRALPIAMATGSIGISDGSTATYLSAAHLKAIVMPVGSLGLSGNTVNPNYAWAVFVNGSLGISSGRGPSRSYGLVVLSSLGISSGRGPGGIHMVIAAPGSVGLSSQKSAGTRRFVTPLVKSIGLSDQSRPNFGRELHSSTGIGISSQVILTVLPAVPAGIGAIVLFEATDSGSPATFANILPRDSQTILRDTTRIVYPSPFTLLN